MNNLFFEVSVVVGLIFFNAFFSGVEMAFISLRKTRVKQLAKEGVRPAILAEKMLQKPENLLATVQVGVTLISTIASAFAGARIANSLIPFFANSPLPMMKENAETISLAMVILTITYVSIVLGELIPKSLGIKFSESIALTTAYPLYFLSKITSPVTQFLTFSSNIILKPLGDKTNFSEANLTEEELRTILYESYRTGTIKKHEHELLDSVFDFSDIAVSQIMTPRSRIFAIDISDPYEENLKKIVESGYARVPVYRDQIDTILGILTIKALLKRNVQELDSSSLEKILQKPYFVPHTQHINDLLKHMQKERVQIAVVTDEHGAIDGIVTIEDILEEIVGDITEDGRHERIFIASQNDGTYLVDGATSIVDFNRYFRSHISEDASYTTISGFLLERFESFAAIGTKTVTENLEFTITEKSDRAIKRVKVQLIR